MRRLKRTFDRLVWTSDYGPGQRRQTVATEKNLGFVPFMRLCIPDQKETALKSSYRSYLKDTHLGEKEPNQKEIESRLMEKRGSTFLPEALHTEGRKSLNGG